MMQPPNMCPLQCGCFSAVLHTTHPPCSAQPPPPLCAKGVDFEHRRCAIATLYHHRHSVRSNQTPMHSTRRRYAPCALSPPTRRAQYPYPSKLHHHRHSVHSTQTLVWQLRGTATKGAQYPDASMLRALSRNAPGRRVSMMTCSTRAMYARAPSRILHTATQHHPGQTRRSGDGS